MVVTRIPEGYAFDIPTELAGEIIKRLTMFRFRSKVEFDIQPGPVIVDISEQIESGVPWIGIEQSEKYTPHMLNLDLLDGISLDKGCYTGQEIVARTHYKGATKRRTVRLRSDEPVSVGDKLSADDRDIGDVLNVAGNDLLAVVPTDKANQEISINGIALVHLPLPYLEL